MAALSRDTRHDHPTSVLFFLLPVALIMYTFFLLKNISLVLLSLPFPAFGSRSIVTFTVIRARLSACHLPLFLGQTFFLLTRSSISSFFGILPSFSPHRSSSPFLGGAESGVHHSPFPLLPPQKKEMPTTQKPHHTPQATLFFLSRENAFLFFFFPFSLFPRTFLLLRLASDAVFFFFLLESRFVTLPPFARGLVPVPVRESLWCNLALPRGQEKVPYLCSFFDG